MNHFDIVSEDHIGKVSTLMSLHSIVFIPFCLKITSLHIGRLLGVMCKRDLRYPTGFGVHLELLNNERKG